MPKNGVEAFENILRNMIGLFTLRLDCNGFGLASLTGINEDYVKSSLGTATYYFFFNYLGEGFTIDDTLTDCLLMPGAVNSIAVFYFDLARSYTFVGASKVSCFLLSLSFCSSCKRWLTKRSLLVFCS